MSQFDPLKFTSIDVKNHVAINNGEVFYVEQWIVDSQGRRQGDPGYDHQSGEARLLVVKPMLILDET